MLTCRLGPWPCVSPATAILISGHRGGACTERGALVRYVAVLSVPPSASGPQTPTVGSSLEPNKGPYLRERASEGEMSPRSLCPSVTQKKQWLRHTRVILLHSIVGGMRHLEKGRQGLAGRCSGLEEVWPLPLRQPQATPWGRSCLK